MVQMKIYLILIVNMIFWGFNVSFVKTIVDYVPPVTATAFRLFVAAVTVFLLLGLHVVFVFLVKTNGVL